MFLEKLRHGQRVFGMALHPQVQRLQTQQRQERPTDSARARVAQPVGADVDDVSDIADRPQRFFEHHAVVGGIGRGEFRPLLRVLGPGEFAAVHDRAADVHAVPADELRRGVHDDVETVFDGPEQRRRQHRVVDNRRQSVAVGDAVILR